MIYQDLDADSAVSINCVEGVRINGRKSQLIQHVAKDGTVTRLVSRNGKLVRSRGAVATERFKPSSLDFTWRHAKPCEICEPYRNPTL